MRYSFMLVVLIAVFSSVYSQDLLSLKPIVQKPVADTSQEAGERNKKLAQLGSSKEMLQKQIDNFKAELEKVLQLKHGKGFDADSAHYNTLIDGINGLVDSLNVLLDSTNTSINNIQNEGVPVMNGDAVSPLSSLRAGGETKLRNDQDNFLSPAIKLNYKHRFYGSEGRTKFVGQYDFMLSIQNTSTSSDTNKLVTRILSTGADGIFEAGLKFGWVEDSPKTGNALLAGFNGKINWLNSRSVAEESYSSFAFLSFSYLVMAKLGPVVFAYEQEFRSVGSADRDLLSRNIDKSMAGNLLIGAEISSAQVQLKYLLNSNKTIVSDERLEIKVGAAFDLSI